MMATGLSGVVQVGVHFCIYSRIPVTPGMLLVQRVRISPAFAPPVLGVSAVVTVPGERLTATRAATTSVRDEERAAW